MKFHEYAYFSSYAIHGFSMLIKYTNMIIDRFSINANSLVVELASNDGYLLQHFVKKHIPVLGVEPAANVAKVAIEKNIPTIIDFFGVKLAENMSKENEQADLIIGNNVLAQVPHLNDFVKGMKIYLNLRCH